MSNLLWTPGRGSTPQPIGCDRDNLILALTRASEPWEKLNIIDATLKKCGLDPFFEVLDIPNSGILGEDIPESARRGHENSLIRALVIQAFGQIPSLVKRSEIAALSNDISQNLLFVLWHEARHGETTLIRWSATMTIKSIWYNEKWQKQGKYYSANVGIDAPRLEQRIIEDQVKPLFSNRPIQHRSYTGHVFSTEYQDYLDFWVYGPIWELFKLKLNSEDYKFLVDQVLECLQGRGVKYGLNAENNYVIEKSLELAERIFGQFDFSQILTKISKFLQHSEKNVRDWAVRILTPHKQKLDKKSLSIIEALLFKFTPPKTQLIQSFSKTILDREIAKNKQYKEEIKSIFSIALSVCDANAKIVINLFSSHLNNYHNILNEHINSLEERLKYYVNYVENYKNLLRKNRLFIYEALSYIKMADREVYNNLQISSNFTLITDSDPSTYEECILLDQQLIEFKDVILSEVSKVTNNWDSQRYILTDSAAKLEKRGIKLLLIAWDYFFNQAERKKVLEKALELEKHSQKLKDAISILNQWKKT